MNEHTEPALALAFEANVPLRVRVLDQAPEAGQLAALNRANESILRVLLSLDEHHAEAETEAVGLAQEIARLDFKLNLALDLLGELMSAHLHLPEAIPVRMRADGLSWRSSDPGLIGRTVQADVYWHPRYPRAVSFCGVVRKGGGGAIELALDGVSDLVRDLIEKLIFRHHRRQIAESRAHRG